MKQSVIDAVVNAGRRLLANGDDAGSASLDRRVFDAVQADRPDVIAHIRRYRSKTEPQQVVADILGGQGSRLFPDSSDWCVVVGRIKAWLITWEWAGAAAEVADRIAGILRATHRNVPGLVEFLYSRSLSSAAELAAEAAKFGHVPYTARSDGPYIHCGHNPSLVARLVSDLTVSVRDADRFELVEWLEPELWTPTDSGPKRVRGPIPGRTLRRLSGPLSDELIWDRERASYKPGWGPILVDD